METTKKEMENEMKRQLYKIDKQDWVITIKGKRGVWYRWASTLKEAKQRANDCTRPGAIVQIFKVSYEFRDAYVVKPKYKGKK